MTSRHLFPWKSQENTHPKKSERTHDYRRVPREIVRDQGALFVMASSSDFLIEPVNISGKNVFKPKTLELEAWEVNLMSRKLNSV